MTADDVRQAIWDNPQPNVNGDLETVMFEPMGQSAQGQWTFWCTAWVDGRCSIYEHRPSLCESYRPQTDHLCWHFDDATIHLRPAEKVRGVEIGDDVEAKFEGYPVC